MEEQLVALCRTDRLEWVSHSHLVRILHKQGGRCINSIVRRFYSSACFGSRTKPHHTLLPGCGSRVLGRDDCAIEAGANPDSHTCSGATPLFMAAQNGSVDAIKLLLRAKGNPLLTWVDYKERELRPMTSRPKTGTRRWLGPNDR